VDLYLKSAIEGVIIKWATQINDVLTKDSSQAFAGGQNPDPSAGMYLLHLLYLHIIMIRSFSPKPVLDD